MKTIERIAVAADGSTSVSPDGVRLSREVLEALEAVGTPASIVRDDVCAMRLGETEASLLDRCLDGADDALEPVWREYVSAVGSYVSDS